MLATLIEAALRSLVLALVIWAGLRIFRIRHVNSQRQAWTAVLIGSLLMPFALPLTARWHALPLVTIPAATALSDVQPAPALPATASTSTSSSDPTITQIQPDPRGILRTATASENLVYARTSTTVPLRDQGDVSARSFAGSLRWSLLGVALCVYILIAAALLVRLLLGLASAVRLWHSSSPFPPDSAAQIGADFNLRISHQISSPVTIGSCVVLPAGYRSWTEEKLRIVLAHERSHVSLLDFYVQILASLYSALTWFSPLGWWLKHKLSDLGEAISDRSGLNAAPNRAAYAQVLLEFAAAPRSTLTGVAMARPSSISRRIEQLLNDSYLRHAFSGGTRARVAVLVSTILFAAAALVRVQAATELKPAVTATPAWRVEGVQSTPDTFPAPATLSKLSPRQLALAVAMVSAQPPAAPENEAAENQATFDRNLTFNGKLQLLVGTGAGNITLTRGSANQIRIHGIVKANHDADPAQVQQIASNPPIEQEGNSIHIGGHQENMHGISISYEIEAPADTELNAATGSGNITDTGVGHDAKLTTGSGNIKATGIEGGFTLQTGSGNIGIDSAGQGDAKAQTGSGNIDLKGVAGALQAQTGSGEIKAEGKPSSSWKLQTGSGSIQLATGNAPINLDASTGSGSISTNPSVAMESSVDHHHLHTQLNGGGPEVQVKTGSGNIRVE